MTSLIVPLLQYFLTLVLVVAGVAKLARPASFGQTLAAIGIPQRWTPYVAVTAAVVEVLVAAGFWVQPVRPAAAGMAALLFAGFAALGLRYRSRSIKCNCFGALTDDVLGPVTAVRNLPLCAAALALLLAPVSGGDFPLADWPVWLMTAAGLFLIEPLARRAWR